MADFETVAQIERTIAKGLEAVANDNGFIDDIKMLLHKAIYDKVYKYPDGVEYVRRYDESGLGDKRTYTVSNQKGGRISELKEDAEGFIDVESIGNVEDIFFGGQTEKDSSITITFKADASTKRPAPYDLDYMVVVGKGKGNMATARPFYNTASEYVEKMKWSLEEQAAKIINNYL